MTTAYLKAEGVRIAWGTLTPTAGTHVVTTGLKRVLQAQVALNEDPSAAAGDHFDSSVQINTDGTITIKQWQITGAAATANFNSVSWFVVGS